MEKITRQKAINDIVSDTIDSIEVMLMDRDNNYLWDILENGHQGFRNLTDKKLETEYYLKFSEDITIKK